MSHLHTGHIDSAAYLAASPAPPVTGPAATAERLVLLIHRGVDWDVWGGARRVRYWDALTDRVRAGTYAGPTLAHWWQAVAARIASTPRTSGDRADLAALLQTPDQRAVLGALRDTAEVLVLRVRVAVETHREASATAASTTASATPTSSTETESETF
jgi:hypothetical protein